MLSTKDALRHHIDCMSQEEAEVWLVAMEDFVEGHYDSAREAAEQAASLANEIRNNRRAFGVE